MGVAAHLHHGEGGTVIAGGKISVDARFAVFIGGSDPLLAVDEPFQLARPAAFAAHDVDDGATEDLAAADAQRFSALVRHRMPERAEAAGALFDISHGADAGDAVSDEHAQSEAPGSDIFGGFDALCMFFFAAAHHDLGRFSPLRGERGADIRGAADADAAIREDDVADLQSAFLCRAARAVFGQDLAHAHHLHAVHFQREPRRHAAEIHFTPFGRGGYRRAGDCQQAAQYKEQPLTFQLSHTPSRSKTEAVAPIALQLLCPQRAPFMRGRVFYF